jgi:hypothetical protein
MARPENKNAPELVRGVFFNQEKSLLNKFFSQPPFCFPAFAKFSRTSFMKTASSDCPISTCAAFSICSTSYEIHCKMISANRESELSPQCATHSSKMVSAEMPRRGKENLAQVRNEKIPAGVL